MEHNSKKKKKLTITTSDTALSPSSQTAPESHLSFKSLGAHLQVPQSLLLFLVSLYPLISCCGRRLRIAQHAPL